jgi:hypothetical protein
MTFKELFISSIPKVPWKGFLMGFFIPIMILHAGGWFGMHMLFFYLCLIWCVLFFVIDLWIKKWPCLFPLITFFMVLTQFLAAYHAAVNPDSYLVMALVPGLDNGLMSLFFLLSLFTSKPLVIFMIEKETIEKMNIKIRKSSYFIKAWNKVTLAWGIAFLIESMLLTYLRVTKSSLEAPLDFLFGWPLILILLFFSVMFPKWYWTRNFQTIEKENEQLQ